MKNNGIIFAVVACFITTVAAVVLVLLFAPEGTDVAPLLAALPPTVAAICALATSRATDRKVEWLANGGTDAKMRAGLADVIKPELLRDGSEEQLAADRAYRAAGHSG